MQWVSRNTGLSADVLRIWERRYEVVSPARAANGHRYYSRDDVEKLRLLAQLTRAGHRISDLSSRSLAALRSIAASETPTVPGGDARVAPGEFVQQARELLGGLDSRAFSDVLERASVALPRLVFFEQVLGPILGGIGAGWSRGELRISTEHWASQHIRTRLGQLLSELNVHMEGRCVLAATPPGQSHELGALMCAILAAERGCRVVYVGANVPAEELAAAAISVQAEAILLAIQFVGDAGSQTRELERLCRMAPPHCAVVIGGRGAVRLEPAALPAGVQRLEDMSALAHWLSETF